MLKATRPLHTILNNRRTDNMPLRYGHPPSRQLQRMLPLRGYAPVPTMSNDYMLTTVQNSWNAIWQPSSDPASP